MKVTFVQTTIPAYRQGVFDLLAERLPAHLTLLSGPDYFDSSIRLAIEHPALRVVGNHYLVGRRVLWQTGIWRSALGADVTVIELNPRILSAWAILVARRLLRRRTLVWGHAWPRGGMGRSSDRIRQLMRRLSSGVVVYTRRQAEELTVRIPGTPVVAAPNALYSRAQQHVPSGDPDRATSVIYVGRLVDAKKPGLLLDAFASAVERLPPGTQLVFVGEGPQRRLLEAVAATHDLVGRVDFRGEVTGYDELADAYKDALVSACPGYAGLSLTQSYWFGVLAVVARDEPHSPEIEAAVEGENTIFVESDSPAAMGRALEQVFAEREVWLARRGDIARACADAYSLETMVAALAAAVLGSFEPEAAS